MLGGVVASAKVRVSFGGSHSGLVWVSVCAAGVDSDHGGCSGYASGSVVASGLSLSAAAV